MTTKKPPPNPEFEGLYEVKIRFNMMVWANDSTHAERVARKYARAEISNVENPCVVMGMIVHLDDVPKNWRDSIPYGREDEHTCTELFKRKVIPG